MEMFETGLKCDNINCDWARTDIRQKDHKQWIDVPCPKCGENVLTKKDYRNFQIFKCVMILFVLPINWIYKLIIPKKHQKLVNVTVDMHDKVTGLMKIEATPHIA